MSYFTIRLVSPGVDLAGKPMTCALNMINYDLYAERLDHAAPQLIMKSINDPCKFVTEEKGP